MILTKPKSLSAGPSDGTGEGVAHSKRWYVALVRMHHEKKVAERLDKMGIENFVPVQQEVHQWSDRRKLGGYRLTSYDGVRSCDSQGAYGSSFFFHCQPLYGDAW